MTSTELEQLIEAQTETQTIDFKADCAWKTVSFAKDILAMANLIDGGFIIIGIDEKNNFLRTGISSKNKASFKLDDMKDQLRKYADPYVDFSLLFPKDSGGIEYAVIRVYSFKETPVICRRDHPEGLIAATIYYRNSNRRVESAPISNVNDLRDLIELAAIRVAQKRKSMGYILPDSSKEHFDNELDGL